MTITGQRTIYVREEHEAIWDRAKALAGDESLSTIIARALERFIADREDPVMQELIIEEWANGKPTKKSFRGRWLVERHMALNDGGTWSVALTRRNHFAIYRHPTFIVPFTSKLYIVDNLDQVPEDVPQSLLQAVSKNIPASFVQPLDI